MQSQNRLLDDLARVATGALGTLSGVREEIELQFRQRFEAVIDQMDLVSRDEFEAVKAMAAKARSEQEVLAARLEALEAKLGGADAKVSALDAEDRKPATKPKSSRKAGPKTPKAGD